MEAGRPARSYEEAAAASPGNLGPTWAPPGLRALPQRPCLTCSPGTTAHRPGPHSWMFPDSRPGRWAAAAGWVGPGCPVRWREERPLGPGGVGSAGLTRGQGHREDSMKTEAQTGGTPEPPGSWPRQERARRGDRSSADTMTDAVEERISVVSLCALCYVHGANR